MNANATKARGSKHPAAKLTEADVLEIRRLLDEGGAVMRIAAAFGVTAPTIRAIRDGRTWTHVTGA